MKTRYFSIIALSWVFLELSPVQQVFSAESDIRFTIANDVVTWNSLEFDLLLLDTDPSQDFELSTIQVGILLNSACIAAYTYSGWLIAGSSTLSSWQAPTSVVINPAQSVIKIASRAPPGCGSGTIISKDPLHPTRLGRLHLWAPNGWVPCTTANLAFCFTTVPYPTKISYYSHEDCYNYTAPVDASNCYSTAVNPLLNPLLSPAAFSVTGGGSYCSGGVGVAVGLAGSEPNVNYTLYRNGLALSPTYQGTGSALSFGVQTEGTYSVTGNRNDCNNINLVSAMTGSAVVTMTSTVGGTVSGPDTAIEGITQVNLALTSNTGNVLMWQKRLNSGDWIDIPNTATSYLEIPAQPGNWEYKALVQNGSCPVKSSASHLVVVSGRTLTVKIFLQGLYNTTSGLMNKARDENRDHFPGNIADRISLKLANSNYPYTILYSIQEIPLLTNGYCTIELPPGSVSSYYLVVNHRNSVETWSAVPLNLAAANISFDFTDSANKAYGDNLVFSGGIWEIYSGDLTQDGIVDLDDLIAIDNQNNIFAAGYLDEDLNGDGLVDSSDMILAWNNSDLFIARVTP